MGELIRGSIRVSIRPPVPDGEASEDGASTESSDSFDEIDYGREFQDYLDPGYKTQEFEYKEDAPSFEQFLSHTETLSEHLEWQLHLQEISETLQEIGVFIIGNLDEDGRLTVSPEDAAGCCRCRWRRLRKHGRS
jgi:RNA polymerase sigma-54 factor